MNTKNIKKRIVTFMLMFVMLFTLVTPAQTHAASVKTVKVAVTKKGKKIKKTVALKSKTKLQVMNGKKKVSASKVKFKSSNKKVATISKRGMLTAKKVGKTDITVRYGKKSATVRVTIVRPVKSVKLNKTSASIKVGKSTTLKATVLPSNATNKNVTWSSSDNKVAKVNNSGKVTGIKSGSATITATSNQGRKVAKCEVTVKSNGTSVESPTSTSSQFKFRESVEKAGIFEISQLYLGEIALTTEDTINAKDVDIIVNNGFAEKEEDINPIRNFTGDTTTQSVYEIPTEIIQDEGMFYVPQWSLENMYGMIDYTVSNHSIQIHGYGHAKGGTFPVSIYYKKKLVKTITMKLPGKNTSFTDTYTLIGGLGTLQKEFSSLYAKYAPCIEIYKKAKNAERMWGTLSVPEKITSIAKYIHNNYSYSQVDCKDGAQVLWYAAKELGLKPWYGFDYISECGYSDDPWSVRFYEGPYGYDVAGHTTIAFTYNGERYICGAEGA